MESRLHRVHVLPSAVDVVVFISTTDAWRIDIMATTRVVLVSPERVLVALSRDGVGELGH